MKRSGFFLAIGALALALLSPVFALVEFVLRWFGDGFDYLRRNIETRIDQGGRLAYVGPRDVDLRHEAGVHRYAAPRNI
jgi:hypothetical protein